MRAAAVIRRPERFSIQWKGFFFFSNQIMQALVVGAGLTGLMTAYALFSKGIRVSILEGRSSPCQGASYSCSGLLGESQPMLLSTPEASLLRSETGVVYGPGLIFHHPRFARLLQKSRAPENFRALSDLAKALSSASFEWYLQVEKDNIFTLQSSEGTLEELPETDTATPALDGWLMMEPSLYALPQTTRFHLDNSLSWSISYFAKQLKEWLIEQGVPIHNSTAVTGFIREGGRITGVQTATGEIRTDHVVICAGSGALNLLKLAKLKLPVLPLTRCVLNTTLFSDAMRITHAIVDEKGFLLSPLDDFLRVQGRWYIGAEEDFDRDAEYRALWETGMRFFPDIGDWKNARYFAQTVLTAPDSLAIVGESAVPGLWLNIAGGLHGADFAPSYAECLAQAMLGEPSPQAQALSPARFD